jgi:hypothetical protein
LVVVLKDGEESSVVEIGLDEDCAGAGEDRDYSARKAIVDDLGELGEDQLYLG